MADKQISDKNITLTLSPTDKAVNLSWTSIVATNVRIYFSAERDLGVNGTLLLGNALGTGNFIHSNLTNGQTYYYKLVYSSHNTNFFLESVFVVPSTSLPDTGIPLPNNPQIPTSTPNTASTIWNGSAFTVGFDEIDLGIAKYKDNSIYVSAPLNCNSNNIIGLKTTENRPYIDLVTNTTKTLYTSNTYNQMLSGDPTSSMAFNGSIEYYISKTDYSGDIAPQNKLGTTLFPILPIGTNRINHERLVWTLDSTQQYYLGNLQFFTTQADGNIEVFQNGILVDPYEWNILSQNTPNQNSPMSVTIQILQSILLNNDILTISYNPVISDTLIIPPNQGIYQPFGTINLPNIVDLTGDLSARMITNTLVAINTVGKSSRAINSQLYLVIILRDNEHTHNISPQVTSYTLFVNNPQLAGK